MQMMLSIQNNMIQFTSNHHQKAIFFLYVIHSKTVDI